MGMAVPAGRPSAQELFTSLSVPTLDLDPGLGMGLSRSVSMSMLSPGSPGRAGFAAQSWAQKGHTTTMCVGEPTLSFLLCKLAITAPSSQGFLNED